MRQEPDGQLSRWERFKEFNRSRSPYLVHKGAYIAATLVIFVLLLLVDVTTPFVAFVIAMVGGIVIEEVADRLWDRSWGGRRRGRG